MSRLFTEMKAKTHIDLPSEFEALYSGFEFPLFEVHPITFFGNLDPRNYTGEAYYNDSEYILNKWLNDDFRAAIERGYLPFASYLSSYDPVCFDTNRRKSPLVALDHEAILINKEIMIKEEISPSLKQFMENALNI